jgi:hypothetical protein
MVQRGEREKKLDGLLGRALTSRPQGEGLLRDTSPE